MKKSALGMALLAMSFAIACHHNKPAATPAPPAPTEPPPAPAPKATAEPENEVEKYRKMSIEDLDRLGLFSDIHFDFDKSDVRDADKAVLSKNADTLKRLDFLKVKVEGHCDEPARSSTTWPWASAARSPPSTISSAWAYPRRVCRPSPMDTKCRSVTSTAKTAG